MAKTTATKKLTEEEDVSVREVERQLDADAFLDECPCWGHHWLYRMFLMLWMFAHAMATGQNEHDWAIHQGWWPPSPKWLLGAEPSAMDLIGPEMSWAEIRVIYNDVYQLQKLPGRSPCDKETGERICWEILDSVKEHLWCGWVPAQPEEELN